MYHLHKYDTKASEKSHVSREFGKVRWSNTLTLSVFTMFVLSYMNIITLFDGQILKIYGINVWGFYSIKLQYLD
jgi:hypothetical protein